MNKKLRSFLRTKLSSHDLDYLAILAEETNTGRRLARDGDISDSKMQKALTFLTNRLSKDDLARFKQIVMESEEKEDEDSTPAEDTPAPFKGMPMTGGGMAADSKGNAYGDRFPMAARIKVM